MCKGLNLQHHVSIMLLEINNVLLNVLINVNLSVCQVSTKHYSTHWHATYKHSWLNSLGLRYFSQNCLWLTECCNKMWHASLTNVTAHVARNNITQMLTDTPKHKTSAQLHSGCQTFPACVTFELHCLQDNQVTLCIIHYWRKGQIFNKLAELRENR